MRITVTILIISLWVGFFISHIIFGNQQNPVANTSDLILINQQIFHENKPFTFRGAIKKNALLLSGNQTLYLSGKDRGIGFYQLRKLYIEK